MSEREAEDSESADQIRDVVVAHALILILIVGIENESSARTAALRIRTEIDTFRVCVIEIELNIVAVAFAQREVKSVVVTVPDRTETHQRGELAIEHAVPAQFVARQLRGSERPGGVTTRERSTRGGGS